MKIVFSVLLFLAISALSADIVLKFVDSSRVLACDKLPDPDDPIQDLNDDEDDEARELKLFFEVFGASSSKLEPLAMTARNAHIAPFTEHPLQSPPFSPPELV